MERLNIYGDFEVTQRKSGDYMVYASDETKFLIKGENVNFISERCDIDPLWIALMLSLLEASRRSKRREIPDKAPDKEVLAYAVYDILREIPIECLIGWLLEARWHEVKDVIYSPTPLAKFVELN